MKNFEDKLSEIQKDMISLALELAEGKIDTAYIYGSCENHPYLLTAFLLRIRSYIRSIS